MNTPTTLVLIIRHGEKPGDSGDEKESDGSDLSTRGHIRAAALAKHIPTEFGKPDFIFATAATKHSNRPWKLSNPWQKN